VYVNSLYRSPFHHGRADTLDHVDVALLARVARGVAQVLLDLAGERSARAAQWGSPKTK
jgi:hypothetical protein